MKRILLLLLIPFSNLLLTVNCNAQNNIIDSLQAVLKTEIEDTNKVNMLNELSWQNTNVGNYNLALTNANDALLIAKKISYKIGIADSYSRRGRVYEKQGNFPEALKDHFASLKIREELGNKQGVANSYINIAIIYFGQSNFPEALKNSFASLEINKELGNKNGTAYVYINIANIYYSQGNYPEALKNYFASSKINQELGNKVGIANSYNGIGLVYKQQGNYPEALKNYFALLEIGEELVNKTLIASSYNNIGMVYDDQGNYPEALKNYFASLKIDEELGDKAKIAGSYTNIGIIYYNQGNYPEALKNHFASLKIKEELGSKVGIASSYNNLGVVDVKLNKYDAASTYLNNALQLSKEIGAKYLITGSYEGLSKLDSATNNWRSAYQNHKMYILYRDSLVNEDNTRKTVQTEMNYEFDKKEQATKLQQEKRDAVAKAEVKKQALIRNGLGGGFAVVLLFSIVVYRQGRKVKKEKKNVEREKERSEELLLNILPAEVAEELKTKGSAEAKEFNKVTVLVTDFKGFTQISEKLTPTQLVAEINFCFSAFDNIVYKYGIEKIKTIGDAYMCAGGLPSVNVTHPEDVVNAAMEIRDFMLSYKKEREAQGQIPFEIRIGIHTGPVVAGIVGIKKFAYDIWGDTVNTASRIESSGEAGKVNISGSTYELVKTKFNCEHRGKITAKNKGEIDMYFVQG